MVTFDGKLSAKEARVGSYRSLVQRLRDGDDLAQEERDFLADLLEGKFKLAPHRPKSIDLELLQNSIAKFVEFYQAGYHTDSETGVTTSAPISNKAAVSLTMERFGVSESAVRKAVRAVKDRRDGAPE